MGLIDFLRDTGKDLFGGRQGDEGDAIEREIQRTLGDNVQNLQATFSGGTVTLRGTASSEAAKEKASLIAGNVHGVQQVNDDGLVVSGAAPAASNMGAGKETIPKTPSSKGDGGRFYTIQKGDTLSAIAQRELGDSGKWNALFEANREVIEDPDKIYPGQQIRIPAGLKS